MRFPRFLAPVALVALALLVGGRESGRAETEAKPVSGQFLVAKAGMADPRFAHSVIYMIEHSDAGAMGLIVNRVIAKGRLDVFMRAMDIDPGELNGDIRLYYGGPVELDLGFVLHEGDLPGEATKDVGHGLRLSGHRGVLQAIAAGTGPRRAIFALGYAGWGAGQLEREMLSGSWITVPYDADLLFGDDETKWEKATGKAGVAL